MIEIVAQLIAGAFLGFVGVILAGDFRAWYRRAYVGRDSEADAAALLFLIIYCGALAVIRWVH